MVLVSHYYNWKPGAYTGAYVNVMMYQLKADAPDDAIEHAEQDRGCAGD